MAERLHVPSTASSQPPILDLLRITEAAALASAHYFGHGDNRRADGAAVDAMRAAMNETFFAGRPRAASSSPSVR